MTTAKYQYPSLQRFYSLSLQHRDRAVMENKTTTTDGHNKTPIPPRSRCRRVEVSGSLSITGCHMIIIFNKRPP